MLRKLTAALKRAAAVITATAAAESGLCVGPELAGFYLGIFVWGGSSGEGTAQDARLAGGGGGGVWGFSPRKF